MAIYVPSKDDLATFEPVDGPTATFAVVQSYFTELRGVRIAFIETVVDADNDAVKRLRTGQVGRFVIEGAVGKEGRVIELGMLTCISRLAHMEYAVREIFVVTELAPPEAR